MNLELGTKQLVSAMTLIAAFAAFGCQGGSPAADLKIEKLPEVHPSLPAVPTLPPPPFPIKYGDSSYSLYGLRKRILSTIDTEVELTGYIVEIFEPPVCPTGHTCPPPAAPHLMIADTKDEHDGEKRIFLVGYAENQKAIDDAITAARRGHPKKPDPESGEIPIPTDFAVGAKIKVKGRFTRVSGSGFSQPDGVLEYRSHLIVEPGPAAATAPAHH